MSEILITRKQLRQQGLTDRQVNQLLTGKRLIAVRRGIHASILGGLEQQIHAALAAHQGAPMFASHLTAARLLDLPNPLGGWRRLEFTRSRGSPRSRADLRISVAALAPDDVVEYGTLQITSPARTVIDCLRAIPGRDALAIADAALHQGIVTEDQLWHALQRQHGWPGSAHAREVLALADGRRESPLESWSAWGFEKIALPRPDWQHEIFTLSGRFLGRCDAWWPGVAGEADGRSKYRLAAAERGGADSDTLFEILDAERARHEAIRRAGIEVIRWGASDVLHRDRLEQLGRRIRSAI